MCATVFTFSTRVSLLLVCYLHFVMIPSLPPDIARISAPLITFCGDSSLCVFIADRFFRDGSAHYGIEFVEDGELSKQSELPLPETDSRVFIMKSSWYYKHSHVQPALCLFCVSVNLHALSADCQKWKTTVSEQFQRYQAYFGKQVPSFLSIFVCPGNRDSLNEGSVKEDVLIREWAFDFCHHL